MLFTLWAFTTIGAETNTVSIAPQEIVRQTLAHSYALKIANKEVTAAQAKEQEAWAKGLPQVNADARASRYTGLKDSAFGPFLLIPAVESRYGADVSVTQPAYAGGRIKYQKESALYQHRAARESQRAAEADLTLEALTAYWNWSKVFDSVKSLEAAVTRMESHARDMENLHRAGLATDNETLSTEVLLDRTRLQLAEAQRGVELGQARLAFLTGHELPTNGVPAFQTSNFKLQTSNPADTNGAEARLIESARANRPERAAGQNEWQAAEAQVKSSRSDYYPQLSLTARYEEARPNLLNIPPVDRWQEDGFAGVVLSWNVLDWGLTRAKVAQAKARSAQAKSRLSQLEEQITLQVREARIELANARERLTVAQRAETSAQRNLTVATDLWHNGLTRHAEVLDASAQLTDAQSQVIATRADVALAEAALEHAMGALQTGKIK